MNSFWTAINVKILSFFKMIKMNKMNYFVPQNNKLNLKFQNMNKMNSFWTIRKVKLFSKSNEEQNERQSFYRTVLHRSSQMNIIFGYSYIS